MRVLILGGTNEARELAARLSIDPEMEVISSLAGRTNSPAMPPGNVRVGGFGGADGLARFLRAASIDLLVDATHPYAAAISHNAALAAEETGTPRIVLFRPPWTAQPGDRWIDADDDDDDAALVRENGYGCVFLALGRSSLDAFADLRKTRFVVRFVDPPAVPPPLPRCEVIAARGPFTRSAERELLERHGIECLVVRNSGGTASAAKLAAARELSLPVVMIRRPPPPAAPMVDGVDEVLAWIDLQTPAS
jgi:precorrin-6A/cobalt-precorrin-6A reductase